MSTLVDIKEMFDEMVKRVRKRLENALTAPTDNLSLVVPANVREVSAEAESNIVAREVEPVSNVPASKGDNGKGFTIHSRRIHNKIDLMV